MNPIEAQIKVRAVAIKLDYWWRFASPSARLRLRTDFPRLAELLEEGSTALALQAKGVA